jgi:Ca-activated chloride channel family protein
VEANFMATSVRSMEDEDKTSRPWCRLNALEWLAVFLPLIIFLIVFAIAAFFAPARAFAAAADKNVPILVKPGELRAGSLLLKATTEGSYIAAPRLGADYDITVSGPTARASVTQIFHNPTDGWVEAVYVYPLPEGGAVDTLRMVIGERVVIGEVKERQLARVVYEQARTVGQKASLIEQERPNLFTNSVANIGPGETVVVQIEYQEPVRNHGDVFSLRVPLVVGPRYNPKPVVQTVDFAPGGRGWGQMQDPVPDRDRISPPVLDPRENAPVNPVSLTVRLAAGFKLGEVKSHHHPVKIDSTSDDASVVTLSEGPIPADRDFELTWKPAEGSAPSVGLFRERLGDSDYLLAFVTPPALPQATQERRPREIVFVIDNSGSMGGTSMVQAKASLIYALGRLSPEDRFNIVRFDHTMERLFPDTVPADASHIGRATAFVGALQAQGGTEMVPAMKAALADARGSDSKYLRQVVFLTDGAIGNEQQLFETITASRGRSRVFMVGIGSAPNSFLMTRAAELGRGTFTHIGSAEQVEERMRGVFEKLESPVATNLSAAFSEQGADATPAALPDLYRGEPLVLAAKLGALSGTLEVKGMIGDRPWIVTLPVANAADGKGLSKLWARRKIADAEVARSTRTTTPQEADMRILALALQHGLVTRLTSLVAVDRTPSRPEGARLTRADVPLNLPAGWDFDKVFGRRVAPAPDAAPIETQPTERQPAEQRRAERTQVASARPTVARAPAPQPVATGPQTVRLPQTATDAELRFWLGLMLLAASIGLILWRRRRVQWSR